MAAETTQSTRHTVTVPIFGPKQAITTSLDSARVVCRWSRGKQVSQKKPVTGVVSRAADAERKPSTLCAAATVNNRCVIVGRRSSGPSTRGRDRGGRGRPAARRKDAAATRRSTPLWTNADPLD